MPHATPTLHALLIGINVYRCPAVSNLKGCVPDALAMRDYLQSATATSGSALNVRLLLDEAATKSAIIDGITTHLGAAKAGDTVLLYFSGHGAEEEASPVFHRFDGEKHTTLVCHDSRTDGVCDLADKELRYLIAGVSKPAVHVVLVTDSCHSGGVTRSDLTPRLTKVSPLREWSQYCFAEAVQELDLERAASLSEVLPEGAHVHLSSCEAEELAYEVDGHGVFTRFLLETLGRNAGAVTYHDLNRQARLRLRGRYPQQPTLYATDEALLGAHFLGGTAQQEGLLGWVAFEKASSSWRLDLGAIHGLSAKAGGEDSTKVYLLDASGAPMTLVAVREVGASSSVLAIDPAMGLDRESMHRAAVTGVLKTALRVAVVGASADALLPKLSQALKGSHIELCTEESTADMVLRAADGEVALSWPGEGLPLVQKLALDGAFTLDTLVKRYLVDVAAWMYLRQLQPQRAMLSPDPSVEIELSRSGERLSPKGGIVLVQDGDALRISLRNVHRRMRLYVALFYLDQRFGVQSLLAPSTSMAPGEVHRVLEGAEIPFEVEAYVKALGFKREYFELKCVYSTEPIALFGEGQMPLPAPDLPLQDASQQHRPLERRKQPSAPAWGEVLVRVEGEWGSRLHSPKGQ